MAAIEKMHPVLNRMNPNQRARLDRWDAETQEFFIGAAEDDLKKGFSAFLAILRAMDKTREEIEARRAQEDAEA